LLIIDTARSLDDEEEDKAEKDSELFSFILFLLLYWAILK
jgi:hypothetical protein